jgi:2-C-methyl-D-erythritol 4-phosphate cytidylyltransferase
VALAENIKLRRMALGLSQQELADRMGYKTRSTIARIESGENELPDIKLRKMAVALDTTVDFLKTGIEPEYSTKTEFVRNYGDSRNVAVVLAGGKSTRNLQNVPNQFVNILGKPVIIYCLEAYQRHPAIDEINIVCLSGWESILDAYVKQYHITKVSSIIKAGDTGILSVKNGVQSLKCNDDDIVILQESTRPLITEDLISKLIFSCETGVAVCKPMDDTIQFLRSEERLEYIDRESIISLQNPEAYRYHILKKAFDEADANEHHYIESCCAMMMYNLGYRLKFIEANNNNLKVVRQEDLAILGALLKNRV